MITEKDLKGFKQLEEQLGRPGFERLISETRSQFITQLITKIPEPENYISVEAYLLKQIGPHLSSSTAKINLDKLAPAEQQLVREIVKMTGTAEFCRIANRGHHDKIIRIFERATFAISAESSSAELVQLIDEMKAADNAQVIFDNYLEKKQNPEASAQFKAIRNELTSDMLINAFQKRIPGAVKNPVKHDFKPWNLRLFLRNRFETFG